MQGNLHDVNLPNLIEMARQMANLVVIHLQRKDTRAQIFLEKGNVVHATDGKEEGEAALRNLFLWQEGNFVIQTEAPPPGYTIHKPWKNLLLEILQSIDESVLIDDSPTHEASEGLKLSSPLEDIMTLLQDTDLEGAAVISIDGMLYGDTFSATGAVDQDLLSAVGASLYTLGERSVRELRRGNLRHVLVQGTDGHIIIMMINPSTLLLALVSPTTKIGMALAEVRALAVKIAENLSKKS